MTPSRTFTVVPLVAASLFAGVLAGSVARSAVPAIAEPASTVIVSTQQTASGELMPTVTVVAKRMTIHEKTRAALREVKDAAQASLAGVGKALAEIRRA